MGLTVKLLSEADRAGMLITTWSFSGSFENLVLWAFTSVSVKDSPCECHIGPNLSLKSLHCINQSCEWGLGWFVFCIMKEQYMDFCVKGQGSAGYKAVKTK